MRGLSGHPTHCQKRAAMLVVRRVFSAQMAQLWAATMLVHWLHLPGSQHWHGRSALAQGQLRKGQEAAIKQKQQRSSRALDVFCLLSFLRLLGGALKADEERFTPSTLFTKRVCSWQRPTATAARPEAPDSSGSRSLSITSSGYCSGPSGAT